MFQIDSTPRDFTQAIARAPLAGPRMFDLDPIGTLFLNIAVLWLIASIAYGRDDR